MRRDVERTVNGARRGDHWVLLDRSWAQRLGVKRSAGVYRIRSRELFRRLAQEPVGMNASGQVVTLGRADEQPLPLRNSAPHEERLLTA